MEDEVSSFIIWCWRDPQSSTIRARVVRADTGEAVNLAKSSFLLRVFSDEQSGIRCYIRHIPGNRSVFIQSGPALRDFVRDCLLSSDADPLDMQPPEI